MREHGRRLCGCPARAQPHPPLKEESFVTEEPSVSAGRHGRRWRCMSAIRRNTAATACFRPW